MLYLPRANTILQKEDDNDEHCRACSGPHESPDHELACCDGCTNSFHTDCLEPPVTNAAALPNPWYCPECEPRPHGSATRSTSLVGGLIDHVNDMYSRAYTLPADIRNYFENVKTGEEGEYIEDQPPPTNRKGQPKMDNNGARKAPDYKAIFDAKNKLRTCFKCGQGTDGKREIIPCDYCNNEWHLDCLSPPAATIPKRFNQAGEAPNWRCPHHIEDDLKRHGRPTGAATGELGRRPRIRRPKNAIPREPFVPARIRNNGAIEVQLEPEEPDLDIKTVEMGGVVFKVPERQIKLDFLAAAKNHFYDDITIPQSQGIQPTRFHTKHYLPSDPRFRDAPIPQLWNQIDGVDDSDSDMQTRARPTSAVHAADGAHARAQAEADARLRDRDIVEQRVALILTELAQSNIAHGGGVNATFGNNIPGLTNRLIANAPDEVVKLLSLGEIDQFEMIARLAQRAADATRAHGKQSTTGRNSQQQISKSKGAQSVKVNGTLGHDHSDDHRES